MKPHLVSNIRRADYAGPEACKSCHPQNYERWSQHSHRWMNALATPETVKGDFSGRGSIDYLKGHAEFFAAGGEYRMRLARGSVRREYAVRRTLGSRYFQYYVGVMIDGPEAKDDPVWTVDHLLPFGYWLDQKEWVPVVHLSAELPDGKREDPFAGASRDPYDSHCSSCHTTRPMGDWLLASASMEKLEFYAPHPISFLASAYLAENHAQTANLHLPVGAPTVEQFKEIAREINDLPASAHAVTLGISCEACHHGCKAHAQASTKEHNGQSPPFYPAGANILLQASGRAAAWGRNARNLNWTCARCHSGPRPRFGAGMATWNSTEYSDAVRGFCYVSDPTRRTTTPGLTCVHCHNPHQGIGPKWTRTAAEDDARCLDCHGKYQEAGARLAHTHHAAGSAGDHCMNCHMPKINEGMQDVVRTHTIFNPTDARMIEANHPNACNLCHLEKNIDWTLVHLRQWYGARSTAYSEKKLNENYPHRRGSVGAGWLKSPHESTRLVAAEALAKAQAKWALPALVDMLDDPFLMNRQFTQRRLEEWVGRDLRQFGYRFYQTPEERAEPLKRVRAESKHW